MQIILDTETTGFPGQEDTHVIEIGAVALGSNNEIIGSFDCLVQPPVPLSDKHKKVLNISGITVEQVESAPTPEKAWRAFLTWVLCYGKLQHVLAFNRKFDEAMMLQTFEQSSKLPWGPCIMLDSARYLIGPSAKRISLKNACEKMSVPFTPEEAHRALYDATATAFLYAELKKQQAL